MGKEKPPPPPADDIPAWFMTYSDVITLLMTFFILLLTFATTEPERFEKIQKTLFQGAGMTGLAGKAPDGIEKDSFFRRKRPPSARIAMEGSEMPPTKKVPQTRSPDGELAGLDSDEYNDLADQYAVEFNLYEMVSSTGQVFATGRQQAKMLALQMFRLPMQVTFEVSTDEAMDRAVAFAHFIFKEFQIKPGQMGVRMNKKIRPQKMNMIIEHHLIK